MQYLGAAIGDHLYKEKFLRELVTNLNNQLLLLFKTAETEPKSAYAAYASGLKVN